MELKGGGLGAISFALASCPIIMSPGLGPCSAHSQFSCCNVIRVARFGLFEAKKTKLGFLNNWLASKFVTIYFVVGHFLSL